MLSDSSPRNLAASDNDLAVALAMQQEEEMRGEAEHTPRSRRQTPTPKKKLQGNLPGKPGQKSFGSVKDLQQTNKVLSLKDLEGDNGSKSCIVM